MADIDKTRDTASQVHQGMQFDGSFASAKVRPRKKRETKIDGSGIEDIGSLFEGYTEIVLEI